MSSTVFSKHIGSSEFCFEDGSPEDGAIMAQHFRQIWLDNGVPEERIIQNWQLTTLNWFDSVRNRDLGFKSWVVKLKGKVVASLGCQRHDGLYPLILDPASRKYGYISMVFVDEEHRGQGIGTELIELAASYLKGLGCSHVVLNAAPNSKSLYDKLGFSISNEMRREL